MSLGKRELSAVLLAFGVIISIYMALLAGPISAQGNGDCPGAEEVEESPFEGPGNQVTDLFNIEGDEFLVTLDVEAQGGSGTEPDVDIIVLDEDDNVVDDFVTQGEGVESFLVDEGPGDFALDIAATNADYTITVDDCTGDDNGEDTNQNDVDNVIIEDVIEDDNGIIDEITVFEDDDNLREEVIIDKPNNREPTVINIPNKPLPPTGGFPVYGMIAGSILAGAGLLGLGIGVRRGQQR